VSCSTNSVLAGRAGVAAGLSTLNSKLSYTTGLMANQITQAVDRAGQLTTPAASLALQVIEPTSPRAARKKAAVSNLIGVAVVAGARVAGVAPILAKVKLAARVSEAVTGKVGAMVGTLSETGPAGSVVSEKRRFLFFKSKQTVELRRSRLSAWLNQRDVLGRRNITASDGAIFTTGGKSWHRGTVTFELGQQKRTITHLQSLSYPAENYYFDRPLTNTQAVALAAGQTKPETVPSFAGRINKVESLCPAWAGTKKALILARLHWKDE